MTTKEIIQKELRTRVLNKCTSLNIAEVLNKLVEKHKYNLVLSNNEILEVEQQVKKLLSIKCPF